MDVARSRRPPGRHPRPRSSRSLYRPLGDYMAHIYTSTKDWRVERGLYRLDRRRPALRAVAGRPTCAACSRSRSSACCFVYVLQRAQAVLPYSLGLPAVPEGLSFNTAASFVTNTNWQSYSPELTMGYTVQLAGLAVQNFVSAAVGIAVAVALVRGFARRDSGTIGNFWVDLVPRHRSGCCCRSSIVAAIVLIAGGVVQNFNGFTDDHHARRRHAEPARRPGRLAGGHQGARHERRRLLQRELRAPVREPDGVDEPPRDRCSCSRSRSRCPARSAGWSATTGRATRSSRAMATLFVVSLVALSALELDGSGHRARSSPAAAMEGKEQRFGILGSTLFATTTTLTSTGAVNSMHDSYTALGGMMPMLNMMLGEVAPGGVGSGLYGMLVLAVIAVFIAGLLVGRTPEYLGKKIGPREIKLASLYILVTPTLVLAGTALSFAIPGVREDVESVVDLEPRRPRHVARCSTPSPRRRTTTARPSRDSRRTRPGSTRRSASRCCSAGSCRSCSCSPSPARLAAQDKVPDDRRHAPHLPAAVRRPPRRRRRSSSPHSPTSPFSRWVPWRKG